jgi:sulfatase maturation enzyme AslB (radical SAM superfamily)
VSKILIKIEEVKPAPFKRIAWKLSNVCNYNCDYCYPAEKDGSSPFIDIQTNKNVVDKLCELYTGEKILFNFTGGEPTLYPHLYELFAYIKQKNENHHISVSPSRRPSSTSLLPFETPLSHPVAQPSSHPPGQP